MIDRYLLVAFFLLLFFRPESKAQQSAKSVTELNRRIEQTLRQEKYGWVHEGSPSRHPKETNGVLRSLRRSFDRIGSTIDGALSSLARWLERVLSRDRDKPSSGKPGAARVSVWLLALLGGAALCVAAYLLVSRKRVSGSTTPQEPIATAPVTIEDDQVLATALPEDEWLRIANDLWAKGNARFAVRALHLAELAVLADLGLLTVTAYKTTADYRAELQRRGRSQNLSEMFARNGLRYESTWYGLHEASAELVEDFRRDLGGLRELTRA